VPIQQPSLIPLSGIPLYQKIKFVLQMHSIKSYMLIKLNSNKSTPNFIVVVVVVLHVAFCFGGKHARG